MKPGSLYILDHYHLHDNHHLQDQHQIQKHHPHHHHPPLGPSSLFYKWGELR